MRRLVVKGVVYFAFAVVSIFVFHNCNKDVEQPIIDMSDINYFPLSKGLSWVDSVSEINIDVNSAVYDTIVYLQRTVIDSVDSISEYYKKAFCTKYIYDNNLNKWMLENRFWLERTKTQLVNHNDNYPTIELVFPISINTNWNRYTYTINSDTSLLSVIIKHDESMVINSVLYDSVAEVSHNLDSTLIYKYVEKSYYAKNVGMIEYTYFEIISDDPNFDYTLPIEQRIKTAYFITINRLQTN